MGEYWRRCEKSKVAERCKSKSVEKHRRKINDSINNQLQLAITSLKEAEHRFKVCKILLRHVTSLNLHAEEEKRHPLHLFFDNELKCEVDANEKLLRLLIAKCKNIDSKDENGKTALFKAVVAENTNAIKILLENGADPNSKSANSETILSRAVLTGNETIVRLLLKYKVNTNDAEAIENAIQHESRELLQLILENGNGLSEIDPPDCCCNARWVLELLKRVITDMRVEMLEYLLDKTVDIDVFNADPERCILRHVYQWIYVKELGKYYSDEGQAYANMLNIIMKHIAIVKGIGRMPIGESTLRWVKGWIPGDENLLQDLNQYSKQIELMKGTFINENSLITYFDLLTKKGRDLVNCCGEQIIDSSAHDQLSELFPDFAKKLIMNIQKGVTDRAAVEDFRLILFNLFQKKLPFDVICCVCEFLQIKDFGVFSN